MGSSGTGALTSSAKGRTIQITLPAQGYLNPLESYLRFDLGITATTASTKILAPRNLNSIHTMFRRLRVLYGSIVIEDIQLYGALVRTLTNIAVEKEYQDGVGAITEGMGSDAARGMVWESVWRGDTSLTSSEARQGGMGAAGSLVYDTRVLDKTTFGTAAAATAGSVTPGPGRAIVTALTTLGPLNDIKHTFTIQLASGLLTQQKLIPLKWLANQLTIELELEEPSMFLVQGVTAAGQSAVAAGTVGPAPALSDEIVPAVYSDFTAGGQDATNGFIIAAHSDGDAAAVGYYLDNIYYVAEILEFDSTYDAAFFQGMATGGVPIKFSSWHTHQHVLNGSSTVLTIQERARSVKSAFSIIRFRGDQDSTNLRKDPYWCYPGAPVNISGGVAIPWVESACALDEFQWRIGGRYFPSQPVKCSNGGAEPLIELQKALNLLGDYSLAPAIAPKNWFTPRGVFVVSTEFESTNGFEMSGINAEELADLALVLKLQGNANFSTSTTSGYQTMTGQVYTTTFVNYDALVIIRPNNVLELVQ